MNEKYLFMMLGDISAQKFHVCPLLVIVTDSDQGKTDTKKIFMRDCETAYEVESISKAALVSSLGNRKISTYIIDDPESWDDKDFGEVLATFKVIATEHLIKSQRETKFSKEAAKLAFAQCVVLINNDQYELQYSRMKRSGVFKRAVILFLLQDEETTDYCDAFYDDNDISVDNLPHFIDPQILKKERSKEDVKDAFKWIKNNFSGHRSKTIKTYARLLSDENFRNLKPFLKTTHRHPALEKIEFRKEKEK